MSLHCDESISISEAAEDRSGFLCKFLPEGVRFTWL
jgi:hypothetical protein